LRCRRIAQKRHLRNSLAATATAAAATATAAVERVVETVAAARAAGAKVV